VVAQKKIEVPARLNQFRIGIAWHLAAAAQGTPKRNYKKSRKSSLLGKK
jgi:hypothetical protein